MNNGWVNSDSGSPAWRGAGAEADPASRDAQSATSPTRRVLHSISQSAMSHRISTFSEVSYIDNYMAYDPISPGATADQAPQLRGRESLVSMDLAYETQTSPTTEPQVYASFSSQAIIAIPPPPPAKSALWTAAVSPTSMACGYGMPPSPTTTTTTTPTIPVPMPAPATPTRAPSRTAKLVQRLSLLRGYQAIAEEEEVGMLLIQSPATAGIELSRDSLASTPTNLKNKVGNGMMLKALQEQEARGNLTGGLGTGFRPDATIREDELLSSPVGQAQGSLSRNFARDKSPMSRRDTIRGLGQDEADRRGQIIEVVVEDDGGDDEGAREAFDISTMTGPHMFVPRDMRAPTFQTSHTNNKRRIEVFYPKPNWRPFSMRAPWLSLLIVTSILLAIVQEILYQRFHEKPMFKFRTPSELGSANYFAVKFVPTIVSVAYGVLWQITDFEVMRLEAFYQLSKRGGALAGESINVDYVTKLSILRPLRAVKLRHYAVAVSSLATTLAVSLVPTFSAASIFLSPDRQTRYHDPDLEKSIHVREAWSRLLTATLLLCALFGCVLLYLLQSRRSGLIADVRGIAGLASMAVASHILTDFKDVDTAKHQDIHHKLKRRRYVLLNSSLAPDDENPVSSQDQDRFNEPDLPENPHPLMLRPAGSIPFIAGLGLFIGFVPTFLFTPATVITDRVPFLITALAVLVKMSWSAMETAVRMMEPYYILSKRHAPARTLTLDYAAMPFGYLALKAFYNGHMLMFLVGFGTVMTEVLTILATSLSTVDGRDFITPGSRDGKSLEDAAAVAADDDDDRSSSINAGQETAASFLVALTLVIFILGYMFIVATIVFARRRHPFLPRQPNTISSILAFIHQSKMLYDFVDTARLSNTAMVRHLEEKGKSYGLGWYQGRDGQMHCGVDEEELMNSYRHGIDFSRGNMPWNTQWDVL